MNTTGNYNMGEISTTYIQTVKISKTVEQRVFGLMMAN